MLEISANLVTALAIFLAGRNSIHTWWLGIIGCILFGTLFYQSQLYADFTLQGFFIITGMIGWARWRKGDDGESLPILLLMGSVIGQVLMMNRKLENWMFWLGVNTIAVPLFYSRGLYITSGLYAAYWVHAVYAYFQWRETYRGQASGEAVLQA